MSVTVLPEAPVKAEEISHMKSCVAELLPESRAYDGCRGIYVYFNTENAGTLVVVEQRDSRSHHENCLGWRTETGNGQGWRNAPRTGHMIVESANHGEILGRAELRGTILDMIAREPS